MGFLPQIHERVLRYITHIRGPVGVGDQELRRAQCHMETKFQVLVETSFAFWSFLQTIGKISFYTLCMYMYSLNFPEVQLLESFREILIKMSDSTFASN